MRTVPDIGKLLRKVDEVILAEFIPDITGWIITTENERKLLSLATRLEGGVGVAADRRMGKFACRRTQIS